MVGTGSSGSGRSPETGRYPVRRLRSAFSAWRRGLRGSDLLAASVLAALSLGLGAYAYARAEAAARLAFAERAPRLQAAVTERLSLPLEDLAALASFFEASVRVERRQFHLLAGPMLQRHRLVYALEWLPVVPREERAAREAEARAAGLTDYRFWESASDGKPRPSADRPYYVPIHFMEPPSMLALGFDVAADPLRWANAERARDGGVVTASRPFGLLEDAGRPNASPAVALYAPVYSGGDPGGEEARRRALSGFAMAIFRIGPLVDAAASAVDASGLGFALRDEEDEARPALFERPADTAKLPRREGFDIRFPVRFVDRRWTLDVLGLPGSFRAPIRSGVGTALVGLLASLTALVMVTSLRTIARLRRQAEKVGPYRLVAVLGRGAMGVVWEARHALLRRPTAVKLLPPGTEAGRSLARFEREVQLTAGLTHPSTIAIYDYGRTADGVFYYAMELLRGLNLLQLVAYQGTLPPGRVIHLLRQACGALSEAHAAGLIHRDVKPANLMICVYGGIPDFLKVLDFGLVKDLGAAALAPDAEPSAGHAADAELSQDGSLLGTPLYMAPEGMTDPSGVDARADLFALGAVGYFLLSGGSPFPGRTAIEVFRRERHGAPSPLAHAGGEPVPTTLQEIIGSCLEFDRNRRPASAEDLEERLAACAAEAPWSVAAARNWWRDQGPAALALAREEREEGGRMLSLSSRERTRG